MLTNELPRLADAFGALISRFSILVTRMLFYRSEVRQTVRQTCGSPRVELGGASFTLFVLPLWGQARLSFRPIAPLSSYPIAGRRLAGRLPR